MSWGVWLALGLGIADAVLWVAVALFAVSTWRRWKPTVVAYLRAFTGK